jgi:precorrin-2 dehydrogenase/sirohydrochlorin ferrochelatase
MAALFPMFLRLEGRKCVVVGAGTIATQKLKSLQDCAANVQVIAPEANPEIQALVRDGTVTWTQTEFKVEHLAGALLVIAATGNPAVNELVYRAAQEQGILCNAVDEPDSCDFYYPAVVRQGDLQIAISTAGKSPALAQRIRKELEAQFDSSYIAWLNWLGTVREMFFKRGVQAGLRNKTLHQMASRKVFERFKASSERRIRAERSS